MLITPFGNIHILFDGASVPYTVSKAADDRHTSQVDGAYLLRYEYKADGMAHSLCCVLSGEIKSSSFEGGECLEMTSMYCKNGKLSIGVEGDFCVPKTFAYDYDGSNLPNGIELLLSADTTSQSFVFGVAWFNHVTEENDIETWFAADPTITKETDETLNKKYNCPCCGHPTYPVPPKDDVGYICDVCWWENDPFIQSDDEPSDQNHGLTLNQAKANYKKYGISWPQLLKYWEENGMKPF